MSDLSNIKGADRVVEIFGHWPSLHDAEIISFSAERALPVKAGHTSARLCVHIREYKTIGKGTAQYQKVLAKNALVNFLFCGACDFELNEFNHQNVIDDITTKRGDSGVLVDIESIWGFGGTLRCSDIEVESVEVLANADV